jgi:4-amino-4-deoxychorismate lyase
VILLNGQPESDISVLDRGLQYGDGLFETMAYKQGQILLFDLHLKRLQQDCQRLSIHLDMDLLSKELTTFCQQLTEDCVIKLLISRGQGGRGYKPADNMSATRIISSHPLPNYPSQNQQGIAAMVCQTRLGVSPVLAGMKHLNRLEQVLASAELTKQNIASEGLMLNADDELIEGTFTNLFLVKQGQLYTSALDNSGVAGVMRQTIIEQAQQQGTQVVVTQLKLEDLKTADELFICNSLIGIWPVHEISDSELQFQYGPITQQCQQWIAGQW